MDPKVKKQDLLQRKKEKTSICIRLSHGQESFIMALHAKDPSCPNESYVDKFNKQFSMNKISASFLTRWFKNRYNHNANFVKAIIVPRDKSKESNWHKYFEYRLMLNLVSNHQDYNFIDEKHIWNHNGLLLCVRRNPITSKIPVVKVSRNFRDSQSIIACISVSKKKPNGLFFTMGKDNNDSALFMSFMRIMIAKRFLIHGEVVVLDNCAIHHGGKSTCLQDYLWNFEVDCHLLWVLVIFLPLRAPKLNPIELVFNILVIRCKSFKYRKRGPLCADIVGKVGEVLNDISSNCDLIARCCLQTLRLRHRRFLK